MFGTGVGCTTVLRLWGQRPEMGPGWRAVTLLGMGHPALGGLGGVRKRNPLRVVRYRETTLN